MSVLALFLYLSQGHDCTRALITEKEAVNGSPAPKAAFCDGFLKQEYVLPMKDEPGAA